MNDRLERFAPWTGVLFGVLFVAAFLFAGSTPGTDESAEEVIGHYDGRDARVYTAVVLLMLAAVALLFFAGHLRRVLGGPRQDEPGSAAGWFGSVAFAGAVVYAVGLGIFGMVQIMLVDAADMGDGAVARTLNVVDNDNFLPAIIGIAVLLLGAGAAALASGTLPRWLAWTTLALGVVALLGPIGWIAFLLFPIWSVVVGVVLGRHDVQVVRRRGAAIGPTPGPSPA